MSLPPRTPEQLANRGRAERAKYDAQRATWACDMCERVTGNVLRMMLRRYLTPKEPKRTSVSQGSLFLCQECWENVGSRCDSCGSTWREVGRIGHYSLYAYQRGELGKNNGRPRNVGHIKLCHNCWRKTAGKRTRKQPPAIEAVA